jgi:hypothetical protein
MVRDLLRRSWIPFAATLLCCGAVLAEEGNVATVAATGGGTVKLEPTILRMQLTVTAGGKTTADALKDLKEKREAIVKKLKSLGASADSILIGMPSVLSAPPSFGPPCASPAGPYTPPMPVPAPSAPLAPVSAVEAGAPKFTAAAAVRSPFLAAESAAGGDAETPTAKPAAVPATPAEAPAEAPATMPPKVPSIVPGPIAVLGPVAPAPSAPADPYATNPIGSVVTVATTISADWPLEADGDDALLVKAEKLKARIREADLTGALAAAKKAAEETAENGNPQTTPFPVVEPCGFSYLAKVTSKDRQAAMAQAFAGAKTQATEIAAAIGRQRGPLVAVESGPMLATFQGPIAPSYPYASFVIRGPPVAVGEGEIMSTDPSGLAFHFSLTAKFRLVEKEK